MRPRTAAGSPSPTRQPPQSPFRVAGFTLVLAALLAVAPVCASSPADAAAAQADAAAPTQEAAPDAGRAALASVLAAGRWDAATTQGFLIAAQQVWSAADAAADAAALHEAPAASGARAMSPDDEAQRVAYRAFQAAEAWRRDAANALYANMTDADWDTAARWKRYAEPDAPERTCGGAGVLPPELLSDIQRLARVVAALPSAPSNRSRSAYLALHAFHSTGLEGNILTLPETLLVVAGQSLLPSGTDPRVMLSRARAASVTEALNVAQLWGALGLADPAGGQAAPPQDLAAMGTQALLELNAAITRGSGTPVGVRTRAVAIGHQRVLLPLPDELPVLLREFFAWLAAGLQAAAATGPAGGGGAPSARSGGTGDEAPTLQERALALACDAHTRFVFVHPFSDGNGRTARTLAALVLQRFGLPGPMFTREQTSEYMAAVSAATGPRRVYAPLAVLHAAAVRRSLACQVALSTVVVTDAADAAALGRGDCALEEAIEL